MLFFRQSFLQLSENFVFFRSGELAEPGLRHRPVLIYQQQRRGAADSEIRRICLKDAADRNIIGYQILPARIGILRENGGDFHTPAFRRLFDYFLVKRQTLVTKMTIGREYQKQRLTVCRPVSFGQIDFCPGDDIFLGNLSRRHSITKNEFFD